jgi:hypothetical protein
MKLFMRIILRASNPMHFYHSSKCLEGYDQIEMDIPDVIHKVGQHTCPKPQQVGKAADYCPMLNPMRKLPDLPVTGSDNTWYQGSWVNQG